MKNVQKTVGAPNGPVIRFTKEILELILPPGNIPSRATIFDAVTNVAKRERHNLEKGELSHRIPPWRNLALLAGLSLFCAGVAWI